MNDIQNDAHIDEFLKNITKEEKDKKTPANLQKQYIDDRTEIFENSRRERIRNMKNRLNNEFGYVNSFFSAVKVGQSISYQTATLEGNADVPAVFLGFKINPKKLNPYAPSAISARIATTDSNRYIELVLSGEQGNQLQAIFFASSRRGDCGNVLENWENHIRSSNVNRRARYIYSNSAK
jgi:hypothetical protein